MRHITHSKRSFFCKTALKKHHSPANYLSNCVDVLSDECLCKSDHEFRNLDYESYIINSGNLIRSTLNGILDFRINLFSKIILTNLIH